MRINHRLKEPFQLTFVEGSRTGDQELYRTRVYQYPDMVTAAESWTKSWSVEKLASRLNTLVSFVELRVGDARVEDHTDHFTRMVLSIFQGREGIRRSQALQGLYEARQVG